MAKRCRSCEYGDCGDMCRWWRIWKKDVPFKNCSEAFIKECENVGIMKYNALVTPTRINDRKKFNEIGKNFFEKTWIEE